MQTFGVQFAIGRLFCIHPADIRQFFSFRQQLNTRFLFFVYERNPAVRLHGRYGHFVELAFHVGDIRTQFCSLIPRCTSKRPLENGIVINFYLTE